MLMVRSVIRLRALVSVLIALSFAASVASGVVLFFRPEGDLARWSGWSIWGLQKKQWESVHIAFVTVFSAAGLAHVAYNWRSLLAYLKLKAAVFRAPRLWVSLESLCAGVLIVFVFTGAVSSWQPLGALFDFRSAIKDGRYSLRVRPPSSDADKLTISELCRRARLNEKDAIENARGAGVIINSPGQTVSAVAKSSRKSPEELYVVLRGGTK